MTGRIRWDELRQRAQEKGGPFDKGLIAVYDAGYRKGEENALEAMHQMLLNMAEGAEQSGTTGDLTYASGFRDAATLMQRTLEQRRKEWTDADAE